MENNNQNEHWMVLVLLLKELAEQKNTTINEIALHSGIQQSHVSRFFSLKFEPKLGTFIKIAKAIKVNFFFEDQESQTNLNLAMEKAMEQLGRRIEKLNKN